VFYVRRVLEALLAAGIVVVFLTLVLTSAMVPALGVLALGAGFTVLGLIFGLPGSIGYHVTLARVLARRGALPRRWWLNPTALHELLTPPERRVVMPWFYTGAAGFVVVVLGAITVFVATLATRSGVAP
jgi:hypothetical protein